MKHYDAVVSLVRQRRSSLFVGEGVNPDLTTVAVSTTSREVGIKTRHYIWSTMFVVASTLFYMYPIIVIGLNAKFPAGYQSISPKIFLSSRYGFEWWLFFILTCNILMPYALAIALVNNTIPEWAKLHYFLARLFTFANFFIFVMLSVNWIFLCNNGFVPWSTLCNDPRYCCVYFASNQINMEWCPNVGLCSPNVSGSDLYRSDEFFQLWLFSIFFLVLSYSNRAINEQLASYGFFREQIVKEQEEQAEE